VIISEQARDILKEMYEDNLAENRSIQNDIFSDDHTILTEPVNIYLCAVYYISQGVVKLKFSVSR